MMMKINQIFWIVIIYSACFPVSKQGSVCVSTAGSVGSDDL